MNAVAEEDAVFDIDELEVSVVVNVYTLFMLADRVVIKSDPVNEASIPVLTIEVFCDDCPDVVIWE